MHSDLSVAHINYILSDALDYSKLICNDAGPEYAKSMHWKPINLADVNEFSANEIYVIDNRINQQECEQLTSKIVQNIDSLFILKIVDPYFENEDNFYYQWLKETIRHKNTQLLSVYEPTEITYHLSKFLIKPIIYLPYVYDSKKEVSLSDIKSRKRKVIISGYLNSKLYPFRYNVWRSSRRSLSRLFFYVLEHPGYAEINNKNFSHTYVGTNFISHLASYKYMLLCGSRSEIEFLKFHECAYSGCMPIGLAPNIYPKEIAGLFKDLDINNLFSNMLRIVINWSEKEHLEIIEKYRSFLKETRSITVLTKSFMDQIKK